MESDIIKNEKLIAEFMGLHYKSGRTYEGWYSDSKYHRRITSKGMLGYHYDYSKIMPVVEKIEGMGFLVDIMKTSVSIHNPDGVALVDLSGKDYVEKIYAIYDAVVEFLANFSGDLFANYEYMPVYVREICNRWFEVDRNQGLSYSDCAEFQKELESVGFTFDYYLDAQPYNLRKIN